MPGPDLSVTVAGMALKNPVMVGSGEPTMTAEGIRAAIDAGAGAVVAKSTNESDAARAQLEDAEYVLLDERWNRLPWGPAPRTASLFCRSGLQPEPFERWVGLLVDADAYAARRGAYVVASLIAADPERAAEMARAMDRAGLRWLELNVGSPHGDEAAAGTIRTERAASGVSALVALVRAAVSIPLTVKVAGEGDPAAAAAAAKEAGADAVCVAGRYLAFVPDLTSRRPVLQTFGAIGGAWALPLTLRWIAKARRVLGPDYPLIGTNGARDGLDVARFLLAGASAVELTTAVMTDGPAAISNAIADLAGYLTEQGVAAGDIIGEAADHARSYEAVRGRGKL